MPLETATYISQLVATNPVHTDAVSAGDSHIRLIKQVLQAQFPAFTAVALASTEAQLDAAANAVINGAFSFAAGTAAAPKLNVLGDLTTGLYQSAAGALDITTSGVRRGTWSASGLNVIAALTAGSITVPSGNITLSSGNLSATGNISATGTITAPANSLMTTGGGNAMPVGILMDYAGATAPAGWFLCYGQAISRTAYPELFTAIGTTWGAGDGLTTFNLPDLRGRLALGADNMGGTAANRVPGAALASAAGSNTKSIAQANLPNVNFTVSGITLNDPGHFHRWSEHSTNLNISGGGGGFALQANGVFNATDNQVSPTETKTTGITVATQGTAASGGSGTAMDVLNPYGAVNKIIFAGRT